MLIETTNAARGSQCVKPTRPTSPTQEDKLGSSAIEQLANYVVSKLKKKKKEFFFRKNLASRSFRWREKWRVIIILFVNLCLWEIRTICLLYVPSIKVLHFKLQVNSLRAIDDNIRFIKPPLRRNTRRKKRFLWQWKWREIKLSMEMWINMNMCPPREVGGTWYASDCLLYL